MSPSDRRLSSQRCLISTRCHQAREGGTFADMGPCAILDVNWPPGLQLRGELHAFVGRLEIRDLIDP